MHNQLPVPGPPSLHKDKRVPQKIGRLRHELPLLGELEDGVFVFPRCQSQEQGAALLSLEFFDTPFICYRLLFVKSTLKEVIYRQQFDVMGPALMRPA